MSATDEFRPSHAALAARAQAAAAARTHEPVAPAAPAPIYAGLVTRAIAFSLDAAIINLVAILSGAVVGLALSVLGTPEEIEKLLLAIGGVLYVAWTVAYFVTFWSTDGQTPANRLMQIRVQDAGTGDPLRVRRAFVRLVGMVLAAIPLLAGFVPILFTERRRGLQDLLGRSVVVYV